VNRLFQDLSAGFARFVYAWLVPSATVVATLVVLVLPDLRKVIGANALTLGSTPLGTVTLFAITVLILSLVFAYTSVPAYRIVEGYTLPHWLKRRLHRRQLREWYRIQALSELELNSGIDAGLTPGELHAYPSSEDDVMPTRLGNALRAMERYGEDRFGLDSQLLWYELQAIASPNLRRDTEDARATVDFFLAAMVHLLLLVVISTPIAFASQGIGSICVSIISLALLPLAYHEAVRNVEEWRSAVQALVNVGRSTLPAALGLRTPMTFQQERRLWNSYCGVVVYGADEGYLRYLNTRRARSVPEGSGTHSH
jgi:hypothetical protein